MIKSKSSDGIVSLTVSSPLTSQPAVLLATVRVRIYSPHDRFVYARALIDQGFAATLISEKLAQILRLPRINRKIYVTGIGNTKSSARYAACVRISPVTSSAPAFSTIAIVLPSLTQYTPTRVPTQALWDHVNNLSLVNPEFLNSDPIDLILGAELYSVILRDELRKGSVHKPIAQNTAFGWILSGSMVDFNSKTVYAHHGAVSSGLDQAFRRFWEIEEIPTHSFPSPEDQRCEEHFLAIHYRADDGRYVLRLPFRNGPPLELGDSRTIALTNLHRVERQLQHHPDTAAEYSAFLEEYHQLGHIKQIGPFEAPDLAPKYYLPHHAVIRDYSDTTRLRVVFNASCKTSSGKSLKNFLLIGSKLQTNLISVILQWRQYRYVLSADIAKMHYIVRS